VLFPGVMRFGRMAKGIAWTTSLIYLVFGPGLAAEGGYWLAHGQWRALFLFVVGVAMFGFGVVALPPVINRLRRRSGIRPPLEKHEGGRSPWRGGDGIG